MKKEIRIILLVLCVVALMAVRYFEHGFYDPLIAFFQGDFIGKPLPESVQGLKFLLHTFLRYGINAVVSIGIVLLLFPAKGLHRFLIGFYLAVFVVLLPVYVYLLHTSGGDYYTLFFVRRLVIQPVFLFLLVPALYYMYHYHSK